MRLIDITGNRYGRLRVIRKHAAPSSSGGSLWDCLCDCGTKKTINGSNLRNGSVQSCGCLASEWAASLGSNPDFIARRAASVTKHGNKRRGMMSAEYRTWLAMKRRCFDCKSKDFANWGGRGISVCDRWNVSFENFLADMGPRPPGPYSIDRIDPNGDYEPANCRWATVSENSSEHLRANILVTHNGVSYPSLAAACRALGIPITRAHMRLKAGMPMDRVLSTKRLSRWG